MEEEKRKEFWPDLVGIDVEAAKEIILNDRPDLRIVIIHEGSTQTRPVKFDRVQLYVGNDNKLTRPPRIG